MAEGLAGELMVGRILPWLSTPVALFVETIGAVSVFHAVYVQTQARRLQSSAAPATLPVLWINRMEALTREAFDRLKVVVGLRSVGDPAGYPVARHGAGVEDRWNGLM